MKHILNTIQESLLDDEDIIMSKADSRIILSWFENFAKGDYKIRVLKSGNIKITGDVVIKGFNGEEIPQIIHIEEVNGSFKIEKCPNLKNLNGLFVEYAKVKGDYSVGNCPKLVSIEGGPYCVTGNFYLTSNTSLKSLVGFPQFVYDGIYVMKNGKKFNEKTIQSYVTVPNYIACCCDGEAVMESVVVNEAMNEPHLLQLAKQLKTSTIGGKKYSFTDIFRAHLKNVGRAVDIAFDDIDTSNVTQYRYANRDDAQKAIRRIITKSRGALMLFTEADGEYAFAITSSKYYRILSDKYAPGRFMAKEEWIQLSYTDIMERTDASWGVVIIEWDPESGHRELEKKRELRQQSRRGMITNTPEQNLIIAKENQERYKRLAAQNRARKDADYIKIDEKVQDIVMQVLQIASKAKQDPNKYPSYEVTRLLKKVYGSQEYIGYSRKTPSGYSGEAGLLQRYTEFTERYMEVAADGGGDYARRMYDRSKTEIEYHIAKVEKALTNF